MIGEKIEAVRWAGAGEVVKAVARYLEHQSKSAELRPLPGQQAIEACADELRREAAAGLPGVRYFGLIEARLDFALADGGGEYEAAPMPDVGCEVLVDGVWLRWVEGGDLRHPAIEAFMRRPWRKRR